MLYNAETEPCPCATHPGPGGEWPHFPPELMSAVVELEEAGFKIHKKREQFVPVRFYDVDAVVCFSRTRRAQ